MPLNCPPSASPLKRGIRDVGQWFKKAESPRRPCPPLPVSHRLAIAYLTLPVLIWTASWFKWWFGIPLAALVALAIAPLMVGPWRMRRGRLPAIRAVLLIAAVGTALSPAAGYFGWSITDWIAHRSLFLDLVDQPWPVRLGGYGDQPPRLLTYYSSWYLVPALFGKWLGPAALNWAVPAWTWCGLALTLLLFTRGLPTIRAVAAAFAFLLFSGLDVLEVVLHEGLFDGLIRLATSFGGSSLEWWYEWGPIRLAFLSTMEILLWGPQHFTAAGLGALLIVQLRRNRRFLATVGVLLACLLMWSPISAIGLLVLTAGLLVGGRIRFCFSWRNLGVAPMLVGLIGLYFINTTARLPFRWIGDLYDSTAQLLTALSIAYLAEFLLLGLLLWFAKPKIARNPLFAAAAAVSFVAFLIYFGDFKIHDFAMRFGAPAMILLAYWAIREAVRLLPSGTRKSTREGRPLGRQGRHVVDATQRTFATGMLAVALLVGMAGPISELAFRIRSVQWLPYESGGWSLVIDRGKSVLHKYFAHGETSGLLARLLRDVEAPAFNGGELLVKSRHYDVWRKGERLIYATNSCSPIIESFVFFAHVYPSCPSRLTAPEPDFETLRMDTLPEFVWKGEGRCVAAFRLPRYDIACIHAGQRDPSGRQVIWEGWHPSRSGCRAALGAPLSDGILDHAP